MFLHNFKYSLKTLLKNRSLIFWTLAFPIILGTFFYMAFQDIESGETFSSIDIAVVDNKEFNDNVIYKETLKNISEGKDKIFNIKYLSFEDCKNELDNENIVGCLSVTDKIQIVVKKNGISETILKNVIDEINETIKLNEFLTKKEIEENIKNGNYNFDSSEISSRVQKIISENNVKINNIASSNMSYTMIEFYTLIAMSSMYGGILAMYSINQLLPNMSSKGKRISISFAHKSTLIFSSLLSSYLTQIMGMFLLFMYTIFVLNVDYGDRLLLIILLSLVGSLAGLALGIFVSCFVKNNEGTKSSIILSVTMLGSFLSGMMGITLKYVIDTNFPLLNKINPVSMITDGLYSLYFYESLNRYWFDVSSLLVFSTILIGLSIIVLRRQKYDSI